ncbi:gp53-like domain-containing protein [Yersinia alsatica]|uniref:gp53-like domain-containing protein n=1 Tax=Yersinia alsatica TaxID=2890317 RepID=UPI003D9A2532
MQKIGDIPNTRADSNGEFTDGNVAAGVPPTILPAEWFNTLQRELIKVVQDGGLALDPNDDTQVLAALKKLFLQSGNNLSEIKAAGPTAVTAALKNLGLKEAAKRDVGTGDNQLPDISVFTGGLITNGWAKIPLTSGRNMIVQAGSYSSSDTVSTNYQLNFPIVFPKGCAGLVLTAWQGSAGVVYGHTGRNANGALITRVSISIPFYFDWIAVGE